MNVGGRPREILEMARAIYPIALHGVGLSIGSPEAIPQKYLQDLKTLANRIDPFLISDHLCFTSHGRHNSHDLLPIPYTKELLGRVSDRLKHLQDVLGRRFMLENPSAYVAYAKNDMSEQEFLASLVENSGCGILLDLNNLYVNQMNLGTDPIDYLRTIPSAAVGQIHLAGHSIEETDLGTVRIDTHDHDVREEVWSLYQIAKHKWPAASTMIEWDDHIPALSELLPLIDRIQKTPASNLSELHDTPMKNNAINMVDQKSAASPLTTLFEMTVDSNGLEHDDIRLQILNDQVPVPKLLGMQVYNNAYFSRLRDILREDLPTLAAVTTEEGFTAIAADYLLKNPSTEPSVNQLGRGLPQHLKNTQIENFDFGVPLTALSDIAALDDARSASFIHAAQEHLISIAALAEITPEQWEVVSFECNPTLKVLKTSYDIAPLWASIHKCKDDHENAEESELSPPIEKNTVTKVWRQNNTVHHEVMADDETMLLNHLQNRNSFADIAKKFAAETKVPVEEATQVAITHLAKWTQQGLVAGIII